MSKPPKVHILSEDRTGGGLQKVIAAAVKAKRTKLGKPPLDFPGTPGHVAGNTKLLQQCTKYDRFLYHYKPQFNHVVFVMDARNAWDVSSLKLSPPPVGGPLVEGYLDKLTLAIRDEMTRLARGERTPEQWKDIQAGFHPHVLVWERESLILAAANHIGLGDAIKDVYAIKRAYERVVELYQARHRRKYDKATDGQPCLQQVIDNPVALAQVVESNPSLQAIVDDLAAI